MSSLLKKFEIGGSDNFSKIWIKTFKKAKKREKTNSLE